MSLARSLLSRNLIQKLSQNLLKTSVYSRPTLFTIQSQGTILASATPQRQFSLSQICCEESEEPKEEVYVDPAKDRRNPHPVETSIRYLASEAYKKCYGDEPVWKHYRRNHKGMFPPRKTRKTCIRKGIITAGNPCPICRDEYLIIHPYNVKLLEQFISPFNGDILSYEKTNICQKQHRNLLVAITQAKNKGLIPFDVPFREYDYNDYVAKSG